MGLIGKLKEFFNKNIECGEDLEKHIVFPFVKKKYLYLNKNILVRENSACVIVYKNKVCDVLIVGKYKVNAENLPETFLRAKVSKLNKKGVRIKKIRADIYFVNTKEIKDFEFISDRPFSVKSSEMGRVVGYLQGKCVLRVIDSEKIVKALIAENGKAKLKEIPQDIGLWIGNKINQTIEKQKINTSFLFSEQQHVQNVLNTYLEDGYDNIGIFVKNIKLKAIDFPKRYQKKVNAYMSKYVKPIKYPTFTSSGLKKENNQAVSVSSSRLNININSAMQSLKSTADNKLFKTCGFCGGSCDVKSKICSHCGKEF